MLSSSSDTSTLRTTQRQRTLERARVGASASRSTRAALAMPSLTLSADSSSQIRCRKSSQAWTSGSSAGSCKAPSTLIVMIGRPGWRQRYSSTSVRTQRGASSVERLATTTSAFDRYSALRSESLSAPPGAASSSLKNTVKSRSRSRRARSEA